jgi:uncharacterized membrane protein YbaN (DUF454 family)
MALILFSIPKLYTILRQVNDGFDYSILILLFLLFIIISAKSSSIPTASFGLTTAYFLHNQAWRYQMNPMSNLDFSEFVQHIQNARTEARALKVAENIRTALKTQTMTSQQYNELHEAAVDSAFGGSYIWPVPHEVVIKHAKHYSSDEDYQNDVQRELVKMKKRKK